MSRTPDGPKHKVLLVEANLTLTQVVRAGLAERPAGDVEIVSVTTLGDALRSIQQESYNAVLLDLSLPDSHGLETFHRLKAAAPLLSIVVLASVADEKMALAAVHSGAQDYVVKGKGDGNTIIRALDYVRERKRLEQALAESERRYRELADKSSLTDELTGLFNRRGFLSLAERQLKLARRNHRTLALFFVDLDSMQPANDRLGHSTGDQALTDVATILRKTFRDSDIVARMGDGEFAVVMTDTGAAGTQVASERLQQNLLAHNTANRRTYRLAFNSGVVYYDAAANPSLDELMVRADAMMREQKRGKHKNASTP